MRNAALHQLAQALNNHFDARGVARTLVGKALIALPKISLPPKPARLFGRASDKSAIRSLLKAGSGGRRILIHGLPGIGKSALLNDIAHAIARQKKYDLVLWLDCHQAHFVRGEISASPTSLRSLADVVRELSLFLSTDLAMRVPPAEAARVLRAQLSNYRALLLFNSLDSVQEIAVEHFIRSLPNSIDVVATARACA